MTIPAEVSRRGCYFLGGRIETAMLREADMVADCDHQVAAP
ncbi:hypothetical protein [Paracraurococcus lichenis]|uniref:Uncharacterized protein n=1 Tax=Paracraurococcus lichenis TaxID=3064888 RepID=A0ABT9E2J8_9PROT|nr:hypothetical protein [Paracraurococcus sp. LOR1-02]MDO9710392.1 hypothetical protein [Paracraurococcus sp. LOR1-02]